MASRRGEPHGERSIALRRCPQSVYGVNSEDAAVAAAGDTLKPARYYSRSLAARNRIIRRTDLKGVLQHIDLQSQVPPYPQTRRRGEHNRGIGAYIHSESGVCSMAALRSQAHFESSIALRTSSQVVYGINHEHATIARARYPGEPGVVYFCGSSARDRIGGRAGFFGVVQRVYLKRPVASYSQTRRGLVSDSRGRADLYRESAVVGVSAF